MESSLYFKTALIVSIQIGIIFIGCYFFIKKARDAYSHNRPFFGIHFRGEENSRGELDLIPIDPRPIASKSPPLHTPNTTASDKAGGWGHCAQRRLP